MHPPLGVQPLRPPLVSFRPCLLPARRDQLHRPPVVALASQAVDPAKGDQLVEHLLNRDVGRTGAEDVGLALGISRSTLQRRLREEGTSDQEVLDATRRDLAIRYLTKTTLRADEIANVLAYLDANSFLRGFRRWTGLSPLAFRQADN
jgi:AraC-like DNA-binding protein